MKFKGKAKEEGRIMRKYITVVGQYKELGGEQGPISDGLYSTVIDFVELVLAEAPFVIAHDIRTGREHGLQALVKFSKTKGLQEILVQPDINQEIQSIISALEPEADLTDEQKEKLKTLDEILTIPSISDDYRKKAESERISLQRKKASKLNVRSSTRNFASFTVPTLADPIPIIELDGGGLESIDFHAAIKAATRKRTTTPLDKVKVFITSQFMGNYILDNDMTNSQRELAIKTLAGLRITTKQRTPMVVSYRPTDIDEDGNPVPSGFDVQPFYSPIDGIYSTQETSNRLEILTTLGWPIRTKPFKNAPALQIHKPWMQISGKWNKYSNTMYPEDADPELIVNMLQKLPFDAEADGIHLDVSYGEISGFISEIHINSDAPIPISGLSKSGLIYTPQKKGFKVSYTQRQPGQNMDSVVDYIFYNADIRS